MRAGLGRGSAVAVRVEAVDLIFVLILAVLAFAVLVYAAVRRSAALAAVSAAPFLLFGLIWTGETFGFMNV